MADQIFKMTQKNYDDLKTELDYLVKVKRQEIIDRIAEARSHGDLSENAEYDAAREEQRSNEGKIEELTYQIKNAEIIAEIKDNSYVHLESKVTVQDEEFGDVETYTIASVTDVTSCRPHFGRIARGRRSCAARWATWYRPLPRRLLLQTQDPCHRVKVAALSLQNHSIGIMEENKNAPAPRRRKRSALQNRRDTQGKTCQARCRGQEPYEKVKYGVTAGSAAIKSTLKS